MPDRAVILMAEDDEDYVVLFKQALEKADIRNPLFVVENGQEAILYLEGTGRYANRDEFPLPDLILLDLKMPRVDGFEVLSWVRSQPELSRLPVLVLTSSDAIRDVNRAYQLGANSFLVKPLDFENLAELGKLLRDYWLHWSKTPASSRPPKPSTANPQNPQETSGHVNE